MANLIIGHTTERCANIWIRGDAERSLARVSVWRCDGDSSDDAIRLDPDGAVALGAHDDYTATVRAEGLRPATDYRVRATFSPRLRGPAGGAAALSLSGAFRTFPSAGEDEAFGFLLGSCNLSTVSVTNVLALIAGAIGTMAARNSLERPPTGRFRSLRRLWRCLVSVLVRLSLYLTYKTTRLKQPAPMLPSPFEALEEIAATATVTFVPGETEPIPGRELTGARSGASATIARGSTRAQAPGAEGARELLVTGPCGRFEAGEELVMDESVIGEFTAFDAPPAFMIHAGDQIYFDFPFPNREPDPEEYRLAYREAWTEDATLRSFLGRCPQYMILDDHEIVDGFGTKPGAYPRERYLEHAERVYREYVHARQPDEDGLYYEFRHGATRFFVLDTRTTRRRDAGAMIGEEQMRRFRRWLTENRHARKFVVSSVPFVAELKSDAGAQRGRRAGAVGTEQAPADAAAPSEWKTEEKDDKWSGKFFERQREEIIELIHDEGVERLVFLVGDMHCAYHATMRIGEPERRATIHELAGGPIAQLQFSRPGDFSSNHRARTAHGGIPFRTWLRQFHGAASGVMHVTVTPDAPQEIRWRVVRTRAAFERADETGRTDGIAALSGRIAFGETRHA